MCRETSGLKKSLGPEGVRATSKFTQWFMAGAKMEDCCAWNSKDRKCDCELQLWVWHSQGRATGPLTRNFPHSAA